MTLVTTPNLPDPDALFALLADAHRELDAGASARLNARLVLLLANHIGNLAVLEAAIKAARDSPPAHGA